MAVRTEAALYTLLVAETNLTFEQVKAVVISLRDAGFTIAPLRHAAWQDAEDHSVHELDTDEDYSKSSWLPLFALGSPVVNLPSLSLDD